MCEDTAAFTAQAVLDSRTLNKRLHIHVPGLHLTAFTARAWPFNSSNIDCCTLQGS